ncbi:MAG: efflux RND transporter periplasmic adaptor subunit [Nitrospinota bacterium]|nr:efflux RND transporter periplasmic adaptor subunit [Nitrospinota bacterium]
MHIKWVVSLILLLLILSSCVPTEKEKSKVEKKEFALPVQVGKVVYMDIADEVRAVGNIQAEQRVTITSEIRGRVASIAVEEGMKVKAGNLVAQIDPREYELTLERLRADLSGAQKEYKKSQAGLRQEDKDRLQAQTRAAQSAFDLAKIELDRTKKLVEQKVLAQSSLDSAKDKIRRAKELLIASQAEQAAGLKSRSEDIEKLETELQAIRKQVAIAELNLSKVNILAPFDGVIISKEIERGAIADSGTAIVRMIGSSRLKAVLEVPQSYRNKLKKLKAATFFTKELDFKFKYQRKLQRLIRVIPDANIYSGNIKVQIDLPDPNPAMFPGLTLVSTLNFGVRKNILHVPSVSLVISEQGTVVYIVKNKKAHLVPVKAFKEHDGFVEVKDFTRQLNADTDLILRGSGAVFPGAKVFLTNPKPKTETPFSSAFKNSESNKNSGKSSKNNPET